MKTLQQWILEEPRELEDRKFAADAILKCARDNLPKLSLFERNLTSLPEQLWELDHLVDLDLNRCKLTHLPEDILKLENLEELRVSCNRLENLPEELGRLSKLRVLMFSSNKIKELPLSLLNLTNITRCNFDRNLVEDVSRIFDPRSLQDYLLQKVEKMEVMKVFSKLKFAPEISAKIFSYLYEEKDEQQLSSHFKNLIPSTSCVANNCNRLLLIETTKSL